MTLLRVSFPALGTTATVVAGSSEDLVAARGELEQVLAEVDRACSRFRADSDVSRVQASPGTDVAVSSMLWNALAVAARAFVVTEGLVDPTVGAALVELGYDRDFSEVDDRRVTTRSRPAPGWGVVALDPERRTVRVPPGTVLDLGATAKALAVDLAAQSAVGRCRSGVLLGVGGDLVVCGSPPHGGWAVRIADSHLAPLDEPGMTVAVHAGALATSSVSVRRWGPAGARRHHIVDPRTGQPVPEVWRTVSVAASTCVDANIASTAAVLLGEAAPHWLDSLGLPALLQRPDGATTSTGGWPAPQAAA